MNKINNFKIITLLILFFLNKPIYSLNDILISPPMYEIITEPGKIKRNFFLLKNVTTQKLSVNIEVKDTWIKRNDLNNIPLEEWFIIDNKKPIILKPRQKKKIFFKTKIPRNFLEEKMATVFFTSNNDSLDKGDFSIEVSYGIPVYIIPKVNAHVDIEVLDFSLDYKKEDKILKFLLNLKNNSLFHVRPEANIEISDNDKINEKKANFEYGWPLYPEERHIYFAKLTNFEILDNDSFSIVLTIKFGVGSTKNNIYRKKYKVNFIDNKFNLEEIEIFEN